jgi:soluble lytic murein transglycosylase-like protein
MLVAACAPATEAVSPSRPAVLHFTGAAVADQPELRRPGAVLVNAATVASELSDVEAAIRQTSLSDADYVILGRRQQRAYHLLESHPDWTSSVLGAVTPDVRPAIQANLSAAQQIGDLNGISTGVPHWRIIAPPAPETLLSYYQQAQQAYGVAWQYLAAINLIETNMGRIQGLSSAGAQGPMQFMPSTWAYYGHGDVNNPHDAILAAGRYLRAHGAPQDMTRAVYAYNPSMLYVRAVQLYAQEMFANARTFLAYYNWEVYLPTPSGDLLLPEGFTG